MSDNITNGSPVDMDLLNKIHEQYIRIAQDACIALPVFVNPTFTGSEPLIAFQKYLKYLSSLIPELECWRPPCCDGHCPPCLEWSHDQYKDYLDSLCNLHS